MPQTMFQIEYNVIVPQWGSDAHSGSFRDFKKAEAVADELFEGYKEKFEQFSIPEPYVIIQKFILIHLPFGWELSRTVDVRVYNKEP